MAVVEGVEDGPQSGIALEAVRVAIASHRRIRMALVGLEHQEIIGPTVQDVLDTVVTRS